MLADVRQSALDARPDLRAALQAVDKAQTDHRLAWANGSTDPTIGVDFGRNPPIDAYFGVNVGFRCESSIAIREKNSGRNSTLAATNN